MMNHHGSPGHSIIPGIVDGFVSLCCTNDTGTEVSVHIDLATGSEPEAGRLHVELVLRADSLESVRAALGHPCEPMAEPSAPIPCRIGVQVRR